MSAAFGNLRRDAAVWGAEVALDQLRARIATSGMDAVRSRPALLAEVDQHAAAVRDALTEAAGRISTVGLAAYADGVVDAAGGNGWHLPADADAPEWSAPSWPLLRLLAVCVVAESVTGSPADA